MRTVIRDAARDRESRSAVGAVQKWIPKAAVGGIEQFAQAICAGRCIGGNAGADAPEHFACNDAESALTGGFQVASKDGIDSRKWRHFQTQPFKKRRDAPGLTFDLDGHSVGVIADGTRQLLFHRKAVNKRPKSDTLHHASNEHSTSLENSVALAVRN